MADTLKQIEQIKNEINNLQTRLEELEVELAAKEQPQNDETVEVVENEGEMPKKETSASQGKEEESLNKGIEELKGMIKILETFNKNMQNNITKNQVKEQFITR
jgi:prefoldin subunit 5